MCYLLPKNLKILSETYTFLFISVIEVCPTEAEVVWEWKPSVRQNGHDMCVRNAMLAQWECLGRTCERQQWHIIQKCWPLLVSRTIDEFSWRSRPISTYCSFSVSSFTVFYCAGCRCEHFQWDFASRMKAAGKSTSRYAENEWDFCTIVCVFARMICMHRENNNNTKNTHNSQSRERCDCVLPFYRCFPNCCIAFFRPDQALIKTRKMLNLQEEKWISLCVSSCVLFGRFWWHGVRFGGAALFSLYRSIHIGHELMN